MFSKQSIKHSFNNVRSAGVAWLDKYEVKERMSASVRSSRKFVAKGLHKAGRYIDM